MAPKTRLIAIAIIIVSVMIFLVAYPFIRTFNNLDYHKINQIETQIDYLETTGSIDRDIRLAKIAKLKAELEPIKTRFNKSNDGSTLYYIETAIVTISILMILWVAFWEYPAYALAFTIFTMLMVGYILLKHIGIDLMLAEHRQNVGIIMASILAFILAFLICILGYRAVNIPLTRNEALVRNLHYQDSHAKSIAYKEKASAMLEAMGKYKEITAEETKTEAKINSLDLDKMFNDPWKAKEKFKEFFANLNK